MSWRKRAAFTLVELLVVIGVIAVLVSMLLPALTKARQSAQTLQCAANLREIGRGVFQFASMRNGHLPGGGNNGSSVSWHIVLSYEVFKQVNYIPRQTHTATSKLFCPTAYQGQWTNTMRFYAMNSQATQNEDNGATPPVPFDPPGKRVIPASQMDGYYTPLTPTWTFGGPTGAYNFGPKLVKFKKPAGKLLVIDNDRASDGFGSSTSPLILGDDPTYPKHSAGGGTWSFRHARLQMNCLFFDGHVETRAFDPRLRHPNNVSAKAN